MIALVLSLVLGAADLEAGERAYHSGRYAEASTQYAAALDQAEFPAGEVLYDLGNCAFRRDHLAEAVLHYRRARLRLPHDHEVAFNLRLAEQRLGLDPAPDGGLGALLVVSLEAIPPVPLLAIVGVLHAIGVFGLVLLRRKPVTRVAMGALVLLSLGGAGHLLGRAWFADPPSGVVLVEAGTVRSAPHPDAPSVRTLPAGALLRIGETDGDWLRVELPDGDGWTARADVGIVD